MKMNNTILYPVIVLFSIITVSNSKADSSDSLSSSSVDQIAPQLLSVSDKERADAISALASFPASSFTPSTRTIIEQYVSTNALTIEMIMLIDKANVQSLFPRLEQLSQTAGRDPIAGKWYGTPDWLSLVVLARHGNENASEKVVSLIKSEPDIVWRATKGAELAGSLRQPAGIGYLVELLNSEDKLPPLDSGWQGPVYQRAVGILANLLEDFPTQNPDESYPDYINRCRAWVKDNENQWQFQIAK